MLVTTGGVVPVQPVPTNRLHKAGGFAGKDAVSPCERVQTSAVVSQQLAPVLGLQQPGGAGAPGSPHRGKPSQLTSAALAADCVRQN
jgi:hypothetical protein